MLSGLLNMGQTALNASQAWISVTGSNIANADTPGYVARDLADFRDVMAEERLSSVAGGLRTSRSGHVAASHFAEDPGVLQTETPGDASPNGNTVSLETEMIKATEVRQQHDLALATYRSGLDLLRTALGRGR